MFGFMPSLPLLLSRSHHGSIARCSDRSVLFAGSLSLLLEAMQYINGFLELGDIHHAVDAARIPDTNLSCPSTHSLERFQSAGPRPAWTFPS